MPRAAWLEFRDGAGELLLSVPCRIKGGGLWADTPAFPPGTTGRMHLCTEQIDGTVFREDAELEELPTKLLGFLGQTDYRSSSKAIHLLVRRGSIFVAARRAVESRCCSVWSNATGIARPTPVDKRTSSGQAVGPPRGE
jgi:hypothetical protein